jgi:16S rRNA (cytidine1402-2'-O)-methyltransferase
MIFYESPKRITALMEEIIACMGNRSAVLAREMTKLHEEFLRGTVSQLLQVIKARPAVKGECTLLVAGGVKSAEPDIENLETVIEEALENETDSLSGIARMIAKKFELPKKTVYDMALKIRGQKSENREQRTEVRGHKSKDR